MILIAISNHPTIKLFALSSGCQAKKLNQVSIGILLANISKTLKNEIKCERQEKQGNLEKDEDDTGNDKSKSDTKLTERDDNLPSKHDDTETSNNCYCQNTLE